MTSITPLTRQHRDTETTCMSLTLIPTLHFFYRFFLLSSLRESGEGQYCPLLWPSSSGFFKKLRLSKREEWEHGRPCIKKNWARKCLFFFLKDRPVHRFGEFLEKIIRVFKIQIECCNLLSDVCGGQFGCGGEQWNCSAVLHSCCWEGEPTDDAFFNRLLVQYCK